MTGNCEISRHGLLDIGKRKLSFTSRQSSLAKRREESAITTAKFNRFPWSPAQFNSQREDSPQHHKSNPQCFTNGFDSGPIDCRIALFPLWDTYRTVRDHVDIYSKHREILMSQEPSYFIEFTKTPQ